MTYVHKLSPQEVRRIRRASTGRWGEQTEMADEYGVSPQTISLVLMRHTWKRLTDEEGVSRA